MDSDEYKTVTTTSEGVFKDRGSKFYAYLFPVSSHQDVDVALAELKSIHAKARHICYAYRIGLDDNDFRINDDGEPSGSAGRPIYNSLLSHELTDTLAAVVRYFGGTKLGIPGLINAYKTSTQLAVDQDTITTCYLTCQVKLIYPMSDMGRLYDILKRLGVIDIQSLFSPIPHMLLSIRKSKIESIIIKIKAAISGYAPEDIPLDYEVKGFKFEVIDEY